MKSEREEEEEEERKRGKKDKSETKKNESKDLFKKTSRKCILNKPFLFRHHPYMRTGAKVPKQQLHQFRQNRSKVNPPCGPNRQLEGAADVLRHLVGGGIH